MQQTFHCAKPPHSGWPSSYAHATKVPARNKNLQQTLAVDRAASDLSIGTMIRWRINHLNSGLSCNQFASSKPITRMYRLFSVQRRIRLRIWLARTTAFKFWILGQENLRSSNLQKNTKTIIHRRWYLFSVGLHLKFWAAWIAAQKKKMSVSL